MIDVDTGIPWKPPVLLRPGAGKGRAALLDCPRWALHLMAAQAFGLRRRHGVSPRGTGRRRQTRQTMAAKRTRGPATGKFQRATTPELTAARRAWGKEWGKLVSESVKRSLRGK